ncbi:DUF2818 family protein [Thiohalophilus thiocyanatoxydans]|uniref:Uncharacterized protein DUF2818 n=1 Tax=Thiohalophilus thiocyanatoxydans TaxID=381308 RepID=A0A4R8INP2_9GAMM|nr:DUF2818 family protein [Thiohalophilus thiocyanatoxydans]TDY02496.1 uncharacterized protein DUF2818 [Thiohalophilus thiocyanatoxydans]
MSAVSIWVLLVSAIIAANLPWASERFFFLFTPPGGGLKRAWMRLVEWLVLYGLVGLIAVGLEQKATGERYPQDWEFYAVTFCMFVVFAIPGFVYRYQLRPLLHRHRA